MKLNFKKFDIKFIGISFAVILVLCLLSFRITNSNPYDEKNLPSGYEANFSKLIISEVVTNNNGVYANENNIVSDYIELYNSTNRDINLFGYGLSDKENKIKWSFPNVTIKANGYLVVACTGEDDGYLSTNFKLSSSTSERIILTNPNSKIIDAVDTVSLLENTSLTRDSNGNFYISNICTPGFENSLKGFEEYSKSLLSNEEDELIINEFLARNKGNFINDDKDDRGFIEFKNNSNHMINLSDYCISNDINLPFKKQLTDKVLMPNEIYAMYLGDGTYYKDNYLGINFANKTGSIVLSKQGKIVSKLEYNMPSGSSYKYSNGTYYYSIDISMGLENNDDGVKKFQEEYLGSKNDLIINEVMNNNFEYLPHNGYSYYDFVELYNNTDETINLGSYYLSNDDKDLDMYELPYVNLGAHEYFIIMCSGDEKLTNSEYYHAPFKIGDDEGIYLSKNNEVIDCMHVGNIPLGYSYGKNEFEGAYYMNKPTPLAENDVGVRSIAATPNIDLLAGVYNNRDNLIINIECGDDVYYTLDGSVPTIRSYKYEGPIVINNTCVIKARGISDNKEPSDIVTRSYIVNENHTLPIISISLDGNDFNNLNANYRLHDYAKLAYVEFFDGDDGFSSPCGLSLYGDESRTYLKKNYLFRFDSEYGADNLHYKVFDNRDNANYDSFTIRAGGQDWDEAIITDTLATSIMADGSDVPTYVTRSCIAYVNGRYWGVYSIREKKSHSYFEDLYNIDSSSINLRMADGETEWGDSSGYDELVKFCNENDLSIKENYDYVISKIDLDEWLDFWIGQMWTANIDFFNLRYFNSPLLDDGKWKPIFYDLDFGFEMPSYNSYTSALCLYDGFHCHWANEQGPQNRIENVIIRNLFKNDEFKQEWLKALKRNLDTTWNEDKVMDKFNELVSEFEPEIDRDRARWGLSKQEWLVHIDGLRNFIENRQKYVLSSTKSYFRLSEEDMKNIFGDLYA